MLNKIKNRIEQELGSYIKRLDKKHSLSKISPVLFSHIREFLLRKGKRIRPSLCVIGYLGFAKTPAPGLYTTALSLELLHDFMLVHDDIIDKSDTRRGKPSMHAMLNRYLSRFRNIKFSGQDLTIVIGDVMYAMALHAFMTIREKKENKEAALEKLIEAALYTGSGEFLELLYGTKGIEQVKREDIYKIYDLKTANYTFASPLAIGAILAGAGKDQADKLFDYGIYLGRAFQIKDDILGILSEEKETGKSSLTDLREAKKTILIWYAYNNSSVLNKRIITKILTKDKAGLSDLHKMRRIILESGALDYAKKETLRLLENATDLIHSSKIKKPCKDLLTAFAQEALRI
ncbi:MAG TPA: polyprenyl synthetase family protein [Candidatus Margulisiibacteriota bacterium]|nr:polyprenyl synthetase family protein [Candidatus Margulisiibacteriota bacterium]